MKLAVLSDIHGNLAALEAVLADCAARSIATIVNLGDIVSGPLQPAKTAARLMALDLATIRGNHERQLLEAPATMGPSDAHAHREITADQREWIAQMPAWLQIGEVYLCHGCPDDDLRYLLETVEPGGARAATETEIAARLDTVDAAVILTGHSHLPRVVRLSDDRLVVNPGSVGLPAYGWDFPHDHKMETGSPHARYAVLDTGARRAEIVTVAYDWESAAALAEKNGRPDWAHALRTGRAC